MGGQSDFWGIQRLEKRKPSATEPHLVSTVMSPWMQRLRTSWGMFDSLMGMMRINPVYDIQESFQNDDLLKMEGLKNDDEACYS